MDTVSIRDLRGADLRERVPTGKPLAITNHRVLIGVIIPASPAWVEHLVFYNWSRVRESIGEGERATADAVALPTFGSPRDRAEDADPALGLTSGLPSAQAVPLAAAVVGETVVQAPEAEKVLDRLRAALTPAGLAGEQDDSPTEPSVVRRIRIGDLTAAQIEKAGANGQTLAITHDRELIGILIPITQGLVQFLVERNISSVLSGIQHGEALLKDPAGPNRP